MKTNKAGLDLIKHFEGLRLRPYLCPAGIWSIGWGSTRDINGAPITAHTPPITHEEAHILFLREVRSCEKSVIRLITSPLTANQFAALVSFTYNLGSGRLQASTLRRRLNRGDYDVGNEFLKWRLVGGRVHKGILKRRQMERELFESEPPANGPLEDGDVATSQELGLLR